MEVRIGYKQTEVGVIPKEWEVRSVGQIGQIKTGPFGTLLKASEYSNNEGVPLISVGEVGDGRFRVTENTPRVPRKVVNRLPQYVLRTGDIVFGRKGAVDRSALVSPPENGWFLGSDGICFRPIPSCHPPFLAAQFRSGAVKSWLVQNAIGTTMASLNQGILSRVLIPYAPLPEQRAIATALSDVDALLEGLDRLIAKKRDLKQAAMQQLLTGQTRLPGFSGEWEVKTLGDVCQKIQDGTHFSPKRGGNDYLYVTSKNIRFGILDMSTAERITAAEHDKIYARCDVKKGDLLLTKDGANTGNAALNMLEEPFSILSSVALLRFDDRRHNATYFMYQILSTQGQDQVKKKMSGNAITRMTLAKIKALMFTVPSLSEQTFIAVVLSDMDAELAALEARCDKTRALKQGMMQELLTGKIRFVESGTRESEQPAPPTDGQQANIHFKRSALAAEIIDRLHAEPTFGHVKFEKVMFLIEHLCAVDTGSTYLRKAAGPYDNRALRSIDSQLRKQQWFDCRKEGERYRYMPMEHRGGHKRYFERFFADITDTFENVLQTFKTLETERCEIVATLLSAWGDLLQTEGEVSNERIVHEVLNNWHKSKERIPKDRWLKALEWMRSRGFVPNGSAKP